MKHLFNKITKKETKPIQHDPRLEQKVKRGYRFYCAAIAGLTFVFANAIPAFAASDPITVVNNLSDFIFGLIRAVGLILLGWGIVQVGLSLQSHDPLSAFQRLSDAGRRHCHHLCKGDFDADYRLSAIGESQKHSRGGGPLGSAAIPLKGGSDFE